jgi:hypothetical protein
MTTRIVLVSLAFLLSCGGKGSPETAEVREGWFTEEGWAGSCYAPVDFEKLEAVEGMAARRMMRSDVLDQMLSQWRGEREDGISFPVRVVQDGETVLLGHSNDIETVGMDNLARCKETMASGNSGGWEQWLRNLPEVLTEGECLNPLTYTLFDYLDLGIAFHLNVPLCPGDAAVISATKGDRYRIEDNGKWINAEGDPDRPTHAEVDFPCNTEGCYAGMLMGRFTAESGIESIFPIGTKAVFRATEQGTLSIGINDHVFYDNSWYKSGGIVDHTGIEVSPQ